MNDLCYWDSNLMSRRKCNLLNLFFFPNASGFAVWNLSPAASFGTDFYARYASIDRRTVSATRATLGIAMSSSASAAGRGMCGVVMRTGGPSRL